MKQKQKIVLPIRESPAAEFPFPFQLKRSSRRRTLALSVTPTAQVRVLAPHFLPESEIRRFIQEKSAWVLRKVEESRAHQQFLAARQYRDGQEFLFLGKAYPLHILSQERGRPVIEFDGRAWLVRVFPREAQEIAEKKIKKLFLEWYKEQARELFPGRIFHYARLMQLDPAKIAVKTQKRSWGSCSHRNRSINLNWQLVMAPLEVIDYVVVHELAHLIQPNHSRNFWQEVAKVFPDYPARKQWLNKNRLTMILP